TASPFQLRRPLRSRLFPYTTLFRSSPTAPTAATRRSCATRTAVGPAPANRARTGRRRATEARARVSPPARYGPAPRRAAPAPARSEEHTSELQSRENLVCRLLLEKK